MDKKSVIKGILLGIAVPVIVVVLFIAILINTDVEAGLKAARLNGQLPVILRIGLLANLVFFTLTVRKNEFLARGIVLSTLLVLILSMII